MCITTTYLPFYPYPLPLSKPTVASIEVHADLPAGTQVATEQGGLREHHQIDNESCLRWFRLYTETGIKYLFPGQRGDQESHQGTEL